jgi:predicted ATP-dependent serine protease
VKLKMGSITCTGDISGEKAKQEHHTAQQSIMFAGDDQNMLNTVRTAKRFDASSTQSPV